MAKKVNEALARPVRTAIQGGPVWAVMELIEAYNVYDFTDRQWGITLLAGTALVSFVQTKIENHYGKGFLRKVPPKEVPVVDQDAAA